MSNVVPTPGTLATVMCPSVCFTIPYTVESPSPVPLPLGFVVKNGSKICGSASASIPHPVSSTVRRT